MPRAGAAGVSVTYLPADRDGVVSPVGFSEALRDDTRLVWIMAANNETGVLQPWQQCAAIARERGITVHCDATQVAGKVPMTGTAEAVDLLSISSHKLYGPQGVGALAIRKSFKLTELLHGGGQEQGLRPGTQNVAGIVGFGEAARICAAEMSAETARLVALRERLIGQVLEKD